MNSFILNYGQYRYLKLSSALVFITLGLYLSESPGELPNGGTWQGYTLGVISAALILFLLWFGIRKRQYHCTATSLSKWASAHVYLGISLPVVVSLHCGFQFGWNVHTLAYSLMILVVLSGFYGLYAYLVLPKAVTDNRGGINRGAMIAAIARLDETGLMLAEDLGAEVHHQVLREIEETRLGSTLWQQMTAYAGLPIMLFMQLKLKDSLIKLIPFINRLFDWLTAQHERNQLLTVRPKLVEGLDQRFSKDSFAASGHAPVNVDTVSAEDFLRSYVRKTGDTAEIHKIVELLKVLNERQVIVSRVQRDIRYHTFMKCWLLLHVPLSCALLSAVLVHVITVFFYW